MSERDDIARMDAQLVDALVDGLEPVRPVAALGVRLIAVLSVGLGFFFAAVGVSGLRPDLSDLLIARPEFLVTLLGLAGLVLGGAVTALAASTPGREDVQRNARRVALQAFGFAVLAGVAAAASVGFARETSMAEDLMCLRQSFIFGALPSLAVVAMTFWGWVGRPGLAAVAALGSGMAFGALVVNIACGGQGAIHLLSGHLSVPLLASLVLGPPLASAFRRWGR